jgi:hypothetical protein
MKRIMSLLLGMSLVLGVASLSFAQAPTDKPTTKKTTKAKKPKSTDKGTTKSTS